MKKIGFKNFRRFVDFDPLELGSLTLLSGGNNSGKSTIVKAAMLAMNFLKSPRVNTTQTLLNDRENRKFFFDIDNVHVSSFVRALNNNCLPLKDVITFSISLNEFDITLGVISSESTANSFGLISFVSIQDRNLNITYEFDFEKTHSMYISFGDSNEDSSNEMAVNIMKESLQKMELRLKDMTDFMEISKLNSEIQSLKSRLIRLEKSIDRNSFTFAITSFTDDTAPFFIIHLMDGFIGIAHQKDSKEDSKNVKDARKYLLSREADIAASILSLTTVISNYQFEYMAAHAASQRAFYTTYDKSDYTAQTIHAFFKAGIGKDDANGSIEVLEQQGYELTLPEIFVLKYMKLFGIGTGLHICSYDNESYSVDIMDATGKWMALADKGMGSIQLMILLLKVATLMKNYEYTSKKPMVLIEEPEQNLHPKVQSLLADLFFELSHEYKFQILVETHSEYLVRKMQVIFAQEIKKEEADEDEINEWIKVYFFPEDAHPYLMTFLSNGRFENSFGSGFFDEAGRLNRDLNKVERQFNG